MDVSSFNKQFRDMSGTKVSFLNVSSNYLSKGEIVLDSNGERLFSPKINEKSRIMSPRERDSTFDMLHQ